MTRSEFRWVLVASLAVILFASLPTLYGWALANDNRVYTGFVYNTEDSNSYIAKMRLGARGEWLFHLFYSPEPHEPALIFPFHLLLGKLGAAAGLPHILTYHVARVLLGLGLLITVYVFVAYFLQDVTTRRLAWALVTIGSGLGWLLTALGKTDWLGTLPPDFWIPEAFMFLVLYNLPHLALAQSLLLWSLLWTLQGSEKRDLQRGLLGGLAAFGMTWIVPFYAGVLAVAMGAYLVLLILRRRCIPRWELGLMVLVGLFVLPAVIYNAWVFTANPAFRIWAAQKSNPSPHPLHYLLGYAWLLVPAVWGAKSVIQGEVAHGARNEGLQLLPLLWAMGSICLAYVPFVSQRRMIVLMQVFLALLAAPCLYTWFGKKRWMLVTYVALASLSNLLLVVGSLEPIRQQKTPIYRPAAEIAALEWLDVHADLGETVLASYQVGNVVPAWTDLRVFAGHGPETLHSAEKRDALMQFFDPTTDDAWRQALLRDFGLDYVFHGPQERELGDWDPSTAQYLAPIYGEGVYTIYEVKVEDTQP
jgi:hypothetical protein